MCTSVAIKGHQWQSWVLSGHYLCCALQLLRRRGRPARRGEARPRRPPHSKTRPPPPHPCTGAPDEGRIKKHPSPSASNHARNQSPPITCVDWALDWAHPVNCLQSCAQSPTQSATKPQSSRNPAAIQPQSSRNQAAVKPLSSRPGSIPSQDVPRAGERTAASVGGGR